MRKLALKEVPESHPSKTLPQDNKKKTAAEAVARKYVKLAAGAGLVPLPFWDIAAVFSVHLALVKEIAGVYGDSFSEARVKHLVAALVGGVGAPVLGHGVIGSLIKSIPGIGTVGGIVTVPILASASTYATGKVFIRHFDNGGTFLDFDPVSVELYYRDKFEEGKSKAKGIVHKARQMTSSQQPS